MSDMRGVDPQGQLREVAVSNTGAIRVLEEGTSFIYTVQSTGAISTKTTLGTKFPTRPWRLKRISATWSTAPTTSENLTLTQNPGPRYAARPSTVLFSQDPVVGALTSLVNIWEDGGLKFQPGDEVTIAYTNTDARTVTAEIVVEVL